MTNVLLEKKGNIAVATINRPKALNALNSAVVADLDEMIGQIMADEEIRALVITGSGEKAFVAGADIGEMSTLTKAEGEAFGKLGNDVFRRLEKLPIPTIAAVNGFALGGGCELSMSCDIRICADTAVFDLIAKAAAVDDNVVVYGESGTGKELAARAIHDGSSRYQQPFVAVNCGAIPESLFESELFGYKKGAFTGATADKKGYLDQADGGTLFLDELGEISLMGQVKLLRAIEHGGFTPVGGAQIHRPDVRIIAATNRDLLERVNEGAMRRDFYYRIHVIPIHLPPLRERKADIPLLVEHFLKAYPSNKRFEYMDSEMLHAFMLYDWPGNVRELQNVLYQYLSLGTARLGDTVIGETTAQAAASEAPEDSLTLAEALSRFEKVYLLNALKKNNWKRGPTADSLGMDRRTLFRKMKDFGLEKE